jgi:hypothetical protein
MSEDCSIGDYPKKIYPIAPCYCNVGKFVRSVMRGSGGPEVRGYRIGFRLSLGLLSSGPAGRDVTALPTLAQMRREVAPGP